MFSLLQWAEGAAMLGWNLDILLQQMDRFLAVFMHLTYHEVDKRYCERFEVYYYISAFQEVTINRALGAVAASKVTSLLVSGILILSDDQMIHLYPTDIIHCKENTKHKIYCESFPSIIVFVIILLNSAYAWNRKRTLYKQIVPAPSLAVNVKVTTRRGTEAQAAADTPQRMEIRRSSEDPFKFRKVFMIPDPEAEADTEAAHLQCWPLQSDLSQKLKKVSLIKLDLQRYLRKFPILQTLRSNMAALLVIMGLLPVSILRIHFFFSGCQYWPLFNALFLIRSFVYMVIFTLLYKKIM